MRIFSFITQVVLVVCAIGLCADGQYEMSILATITAGIVRIEEKLRMLEITTNSHYSLYLFDKMGISNDVREEIIKRSKK